VKFSRNVPEARIMSVLENGFDVDGQRYEFLAFSDSQLRERSCTFFATSPYLGIQDVISWLGDFSSITNTSKYAVRLGQCFSPTRPSIVLNDWDFIVEEDIVRNGYEFTEGCGRISTAAAAQVAALLHLKPVPSAFQIRFGEFKGVLVVDPSLVNVAVAFRKSQQKFVIHSRTEEQRTLEILEFTKQTKAANLNRQFLMILCELGVSQSYFEQMMCNELRRKEQTGRSKSCLEMVLRLRDNLSIPVQRSRNLMGVADISEELQEGEVFVQIHVNGKLRMLQGNVVVMKSPSLHLGDLRILKAVNVPNLSSLTNCIVFSTKGQQPDFNAIAGSVSI
jgi:hypothetical protein